MTQSPQLLASVNLESPLLWAVVIAWILTVVLHEFAHGLVAHLGGDYTIKERGGLSLNPINYIDPLFSIVLPVVFLLLGGVPLSGGVTYVRTDLLRSRAWESGVSLAGPAMNFLIFIVLCASMHPAFGWFDPTIPVADWTNGQLVVATLAMLQAWAVVLNLIPWPPVDGFNALAPYLPQDLVHRVRTPPLNFILMAAFFLVVTRIPPVQNAFLELLQLGPRLVGLDRFAALQMFQASEFVFG